MRFFLLALTIVLLGGCAATAPRPASLPDIVVSADALARGIDGAVVVHVARDRAAQGIGADSKTRTNVRRAFLNHSAWGFGLFYKAEIKNGLKIM